MKETPKVETTSVMSEKAIKCPHCDSELLPWLAPAESSWGQRPQLVCFNDECSYFVEGWEWMHENFQQRASYRHRHDPVTGETGPLPVWSKDALRNNIVAEEVDEKE